MDVMDGAIRSGGGFVVPKAGLTASAFLIDGTEPTFMCFQVSELLSIFNLQMNSDFGGFARKFCKENFLLLKSNDLQRVMNCTAMKIGSSRQFKRYPVFFFKQILAEILS